MYRSTLAMLVHAASSRPPTALRLIVLPAITTAPPVGRWGGWVVVEAWVLLLIVQRHRQGGQLLLHAPAMHVRAWRAPWITARTTAATAGPFAVRGDTSWPVASAKVRAEAL